MFEKFHKKSQNSLLAQKKTTKQKNSKMQKNRKSTLYFRMHQNLLRNTHEKSISLENFQNNIQTQ